MIVEWLYKTYIKCTLTAGSVRVTWASAARLDSPSCAARVISGPPVQWMNTIIAICHWNGIIITGCIDNSTYVRIFIKPAQVKGSYVKSTAIDPTGSAQGIKLSESFACDDLKVEQWSLWKWSLSYAQKVGADFVEELIRDSLLKSSFVAVDGGYKTEMSCHQLLLILPVRIWQSSPILLSTMQQWASMTSQIPDYKYVCKYATLASDHMCFPSSGQLPLLSGCRK